MLNSPLLRDDPDAQPREMPRATPTTSRRPRILHIVPTYFGQGGIVGGAERYALELARHMAEWTPTELVSFGDEARQEMIGRLQVRILGNPWYVRGQRTNPFTWALFRHLLRADVVHCHQQHVLTSSAAALACRLLGRRVFVSDLGGGGWDVSSYLSTDRWYHGHLHLSRYSRAVFGHEKQPWAHVVYGGVDTDKFSPDPSASRTSTVLFVGRLMPHKGVNDLVAGLPDDLPLELIGQPYDAAFLAELQRIGAGKRIRFRTDCNDAALTEAYRRALCVVLPSVYRDLYGHTTRVPELLGQTLLEGMACGIPAICTAVASMPEVVEDGVTGFVVPPNDPETLRARLCWLRDHPAEAQAMGRAARVRVLKRFNWDAVVRRCLHIYATRPSAPLRRGFLFHTTL
jgi:glycosyltransferase involved in cell wall biosynthesis